MEEIEDRYPRLGFGKRAHRIGDGRPEFPWDSDDIMATPTVIDPKGLLFAP